MMPVSDRAPYLAHLISIFPSLEAQHRTRLLSLAVRFVQRTAPQRSRRFLILEAKKDEDIFDQQRRPLGRRKETGSCGRDGHYFGFVHGRPLRLSTMELVGVKLRKETTLDFHHDCFS